MVDVTISNYENNINNDINIDINNDINIDINNDDNNVNNINIISEQNNYEFLIKKKHLKNKLNKTYSFSNINDECAVCLDEINLGKVPLTKDVIQLTCKHIYHYNCLYKWLINCGQIRNKLFKCPTCNQMVKVDAHFKCLDKYKTEESIDIKIYLDKKNYEHNLSNRMPRNSYYNNYNINNTILNSNDNGSINNDSINNGSNYDNDSNYDNGSINNGSINNGSINNGSINNGNNNLENPPENDFLEFYRTYYNDRINILNNFRNNNTRTNISISNNTQINNDSNHNLNIVDDYRETVRINNYTNNTNNTNNNSNIIDTRNTRNTRNSRNTENARNTRNTRNIRNTGNTGNTGNARNSNSKCCVIS